MPGEDRQEHEGRAEVGLHHHQHPRRGHEQARAEDGPQRVQLPLAVAEVGGKHGDHEDLRELGELEGQRPDAHPPRRVADAAAEREGEHEQPEVHEVDRPRERLEPAVVEQRREDEHDHPEARPHERTRERRAAVEGGLPRLDAVRVGHDETDRAEQRHVRRELQVVGAPDRPDGPRGHVGEAVRLGPHHAHRRLPLVALVEVATIEEVVVEVVLLDLEVQLEERLRDLGAGVALRPRVIGEREEYEL